MPTAYLLQGKDRQPRARQTFGRYGIVRYTENSWIVSEDETADARHADVDRDVASVPLRHLGGRNGVDVLVPDATDQRHDRGTEYFGRAYRRQSRSKTAGAATSIAAQRHRDQRGRRRLVGFGARVPGLQRRALRRVRPVHLPVFRK